MQRFSRYLAVATAVALAGLTQMPIAANATVPAQHPKPVVAGSASAASVSPDLGGWGYIWKVTSIGANTKAYGAWNSCSSFSAESTAHTVSCTVTVTWTSQLSGQIQVTDGTASAAVGYSVSHSYSVAGGETYSVPKNRSGIIQWRRAFSDNKIYQKEYLCTFGGCQEKVYGTATAMAQKFLGPNFRVVYN